MALNSVMKHNFANVPAPKLERSTFDRSHGYKTTFDASWLVPIFVDEVLPGDTFTVRGTLFARLATPIVPFMDNIFLDTFWFFVPNRLVWAGWENFISGISDLSPKPMFLPSAFEGITIPKLRFAITPELMAAPATDDTGNVVNIPANNAHLLNYMGLPISSAVQEFSALPYVAYNTIWFDWFADQNLQQDGQPFNREIAFYEAVTGSPPPSFPWGMLPPDFGTRDLGTEVGATSYFGLLPRGKRHDYFTSCLPWPQKGPGVEIEIGTDAYAPLVIDPTMLGSQIPQLNFVGAGAGTTISSASIGQSQFNIGDGLISVDAEIENATTDSIDGVPEFGTPVDHNPIALGTLRPWQADLSGVVFNPITINELREAFQLQKMLEKDARGGSRYTEQLRSHFGVISPDARLQRAEYLGGSSQRMYITPVQQTSATDTTSPQGNLAAYGATSLNCGFHKSFLEHGYVFGLINARADITYAQGRNRMWDRSTRYDFYWPTLAHLGEQPVLNSEIYVTGTDSDNDVFGYQERWAEYRYKPSLVTGAFSPEYPSGLPQWTLCEDFASQPTLNNIFIRDSSRRRIDRVIATPNEPQFLLDCFFDFKCAREMPVYSVPGLIDHF